MRAVVEIQIEKLTAPRYAAVIEWARRSGWRLALGISITVWGILATRLFLN